MRNLHSLLKPLVSVLVVMATLVSVEAGFMAANRRAGIHLGFLVEMPMPGGFPTGRALSFIDPLLGATFNPARLGDDSESYLHGFVVEGDPLDPKALRIVTLGGSTTESSDGCWPSRLRELLVARGVPAVVFNGGVSGYNIDQEVLKQLRDVSQLRPHLVITYDGANDLRDAGIPLARLHPYAHRVHDRLIDLALTGGRPVLLPNAVVGLRRIAAGATFEGVERGVPRFVTPAQAWFRNVRLAHAIAESEGYRHVGYLQPVFGVGEHRPAEDESERIRAAGDAPETYRANYPEAMALVAGSGGVAVDLTGILSGMKDVFRDTCHVTRQGNEAVARAILSDLDARGWVPPAGRSIL